jgi:hypothetical protein
MVRINKFEFMDCLGVWIESDGNYYIDLEKKVYSGEPIKQVIEIYKDITDDARPYRFYNLLLNDDAELFVRVKFEQ